MDDIASWSIEGLPLEAALKFQTERITVLKSELSSAGDILQEQQSQLESANSRIKDLSTQLATVLKKEAQSKIAIERLEKKVNALSNRSSELQTENSNLKSILDERDREGRQAVSKAGNKEMQLNRANETVSRLQAKLQTVEREFTEERKTFRAELDESKHLNRQLKKQQSEMIEAMKKQQQLIVALKKQKVHLEASRLLDITAEEWGRITSLD
ncbi:hypothetical protein RCL1_008457 [Eukaryota sp. TZLM3-RCL]